MHTHLGGRSTSSLITCCVLISVGCTPSFAQGPIATMAGGSKILASGTLQPLNTPVVPVGLVAAPNGDIYFSNQPFNSVLKLDSRGQMTVVAGNGISGFSNDGGLAVKAALAGPVGLALDGAGNLYIADSQNNRIRRVSPDGIITTVAGTGQSGFSGDGGPASTATLAAPIGVAVDSSGNLFIVDELNFRVRKVNSSGLIVTYAGNGVRAISGDGGAATSASFVLAQDIAVDGRGNLYVADSTGCTIRRIDQSGIITTIAGNGQCASTGDGRPAVNAQVFYPRGVSVDAANNVYFAEAGNRVRRINAAGAIATVVGGDVAKFSGDGGPSNQAGLAAPIATAVDSLGRLSICDTGNRRIRRVGVDGTISTILGSGEAVEPNDGAPSTAASLFSPVDMTFDGLGNLYIADQGDQRVRRIAPDGTIITVAGNGTVEYGGDGGSATAASLAYPSGVAVDSARNLYIADRNSHRIRRVTPSGVLTTIAGTGQAGHSGDGGNAAAALLQFPSSLVFDSAQNLYISDSGNNCVRRITPDGIITTVAGNTAAGFSGDGGPGTSASLYLPGGLAVDAIGNLYIADAGNNRIRRLSPAGVISTVAGRVGGLGDFSGDGGPATNAGLRGPSAVAIDASGNLYIADQQNTRIRRVGADGIITTVAGTGQFGFSGDGGLAINAQLQFPQGLVFDAAGNLYIADRDNNRIRVILSKPATFSVSRGSLSFSAAAGGVSPAPESLALTTSVLNSTLNANGLVFTASSSASWVHLSSNAGTAPATLTVTVDPTSLAPGEYSSNIGINAPLAVPAAQNVVVKISVTAGQSPTLGVNTTSLSFGLAQGASASTQTVTLSILGGATLSFTAVATSSTGGAWLSVSPSNGTATPSSPASLTVTAAPGSLVPGTYTGAIKITGAGSTISIPVTLSVSAPTAIILVSQSALSFAAVAQGGVPLPQNFGILNTGQGSMSWTAAVSTLSGGNWLQLSPSNGTVQRPYLDVSLVTVSIDPSTLAAGTYYGRIQVAATAANTPQVMTVILTVLPAGLTLGPQVFPTGLIFTGVAGVTPGSQDVQVGNPTGQVNNFQSGLIGVGFSFLPTNASVQPNQPTTVRVFPDFSHLTPGSIQQGTITLRFSDRSPSQTINVLTVVAPSGSTPSGLSAGAYDEGARDDRWYRIDVGPNAASACASQALQVQYRSLQPNFAAVTGQATTLDVQVSDGCGNLVGPGGQSAQVAAYFSNNDPQVAMTHIGNGIWQGTWRPVNGSGLVAVKVTAFLQQGGSLVGGVSSALTGVVSVPAPAATTPMVTAKGVVHAASDQGGVPIAPGGLITVYGVNLADGVGQSNGLPLPQQLNGAQVLLGNQPLPILYTSTGQMNVQVPYTVPVNTQYQLTVQHGATLSVPQSLVVAQAQPGIFTSNQQGTGQGSIVKSDQVTLAQPGTPASIGETIVIYCTGLGAVTPAVKEGSPAPTTPPLSTTVNPVTVTIGGKAAQVAFSGLTPGYAGLYQVNVVVPTGITTGDAVPVVLSVAGQTSPAVTMAVR